LLASWLLAAFKRQAGDRSEDVRIEVPHTFRIVSRAEAQFLTSGSAQPVHNALSVDLEDYFHTEVAAQVVPYSEWDGMPSRIESSVLRLLDLLDEHETKTTVFVLGWIANKYPALIREVADRGHEIGCHSYQHRPVFKLDRDAFRKDTRMALESLESAIGRSVQGYRAPSFSIIPGTEWAFDTLAELGFQYDSSVHPVHHKTYGNPSASRHPYFLPGSGLLEIPIATRRIAGTNFPMGGGAYLRILPYKYVHAGLTYLNHAELKPGTLYIHPWEIDIFQPPLGLKWQSHLRQNWGVHSMETRLIYLLSSFRFAPIAEVYSNLLSAGKPSKGTFDAERSLYSVAN
jgi:polysaccharide deacetylase family protein (PEP-CTERM system associated)